MEKETIKMKKTFSEEEAEFEMTVNINVGITEHVRHEVNCNQTKGGDYTLFESCSNAGLEELCVKMELLARNKVIDPVKILKNIGFE